LRADTFAYRLRDRHVTKGLCVLERARAGSESAVLAAFSPLRSRKLMAAV
jgi:hypothetical protein